MNNIYIILFSVIAISVFGAGFLVARQLRAFQNVPIFSMMFVQRRFLFSIIMGCFISLVLMAVLGFIDGFTSQLFLSVFGIFLLASCSYYFGVYFGWGKPDPPEESISVTTSQSEIGTSFSENIIVENSLASMKITINSKRRWALIAMEIFNLVFIGLFGLPLMSLAAIFFLQHYLPQNLHFFVWPLVGGLALYLLYKKVMEVIECIFNKEVIEINDLSVRIERYGSIFSNKKEFSVDNIKKITTMFSLGGKNAALKRSPFVNSSMPVFMVWHNRGLKRYYTFGIAVDLADAQRLLEIVYARFPQYKG